MCESAFCLSVSKSAVSKSALADRSSVAGNLLRFAGRSRFDAKERAVLQAKRVVIDRRLLSDLTEAAQEPTIEVGTLVRSEIVAERLVAFFAPLVSTGAVKRAL